ncbi:MAG: competence protein ComF, partial [Alphaproteobacteria bacterium]|nr:competence protein ComF [Alphaproteobacteria bacterium]
DLLIPVPLHRWRLLKRRYNQAGLLANSLSKQCGIAVSHHALRRTKSTPPQGRKTKNERLENIHGVFAVPEKYLRIVQGKNIVLLDDVYTSGATVNECAKVLLKAGAKSVDVLAVAKVVRE